MVIDPLSDIRISPEISGLPKVDLHIHQEDLARFESFAAHRSGRAPFDPRPWIRQMMADIPAGIGRIDGIYIPDNYHDFAGLAQGDPAMIVAKMANAMLEGAGDGAIYMELRFGAGSIAFNQPDFIPLFREAESQVRAEYPKFYAEALCFMVVSNNEEEVEKQFEACLRAAGAGLVGVDFRIDPYDSEADSVIWKRAYQLAEKAVDAGLGITIHVGEFSPANLIAATRTPGVRRLGHAVYSVSTPQILEAVLKSGVTVECSLTCNVVLGAVDAYENHPIRKLVENKIPVTLATDLPVHLHTTIGREYALAAELGFSILDLKRMTRNGMEASFTSGTRRGQLLRWI